MSEINWHFKQSPDLLKAMLVEQFDTFWSRELGIEREALQKIKVAANAYHAVIISGLRRVGKSTLLAQLAHELGKENFYYLNFEDDRFLGFGIQDLTLLQEILVSSFGERKIFLIDEIQNLANWELFIRRFMDLGYKFYITGSNSSLLSRELGTLLTGRYIPVELFPFEFSEFLLYKQVALPNLNRMTIAERGLLNSQLDSYIREGGIPDAIKYPELPILSTLFNDVLYRDIATRNRIENVDALKQLAFTLISNPAGLVSFNKLKDQLRLGSVNTVSSYIDLLQNAWLMFAVNTYAFSVKKQQIAAKKIYSIDTGLVNNVGFSFSPNQGKLLENLVFLALRQKHQDVYYFTSSKGTEIDFYLPGKKQLIQVTSQFSASSVQEREYRAIKDAIAELPVDSALILTDSNHQDIDIEGKPVQIKWIAQWLLNPQ